MGEFALLIICCWPWWNKRVYLCVVMTELLITYSWLLFFDRWLILKTINNRTGVWFTIWLWATEKNESEILSQFSNRILDSVSFSCGCYQTVTNWTTCGSTSPNVTDTSSLNPPVKQIQPLYVTRFIPPFSLLSYLTSPYFQFVEEML